MEIFQSYTNNLKNGRLKGGLVSLEVFSCIVFVALINLSKVYLEDFKIIEGENGP